MDIAYLVHTIRPIMNRFCSTKILNFSLNSAQIRHQAQAFLQGTPISVHRIALLGDLRNIQLLRFF